MSSELTTPVSLGAAASGTDAGDHCSLTIAVNVYLYIVVPKGFFPQQDTGRMGGKSQADQDISFQAMRRSCTLFVVNIVQADPRSRT